MSVEAEQSASDSLKGSCYPYTLEHEMMDRLYTLKSRMKDYSVSEVERRWLKFKIEILHNAITDLRKSWWF